MTELGPVNVVSDPVDGQAGVGVLYEPEASGPVTKVRVAQLWEDGDTDQIHVREGELVDLIYCLLRVHMDLQGSEYSPARRE